MVELGGTIDAATMRDLNYAVDAGKADVARVVGELLDRLDNT